MINKPSFKDKQKTMFERQLKLRNNPTPSELIFKDRLEKIGIRAIFQKCFIAGDFYCIADFYIPKPFKIVFEIDGEYHETDEQKKKDYAKDRYLTNTRKLKVIRIKNEDVEKFDLTFLTI